MTEDGVIYCDNCNKSAGLVTYGKEYTVTCPHCLEDMVLNEYCSYDEDEVCENSINCKGKDN